MTVYMPMDNEVEEYAILRRKSAEWIKRLFPWKNYT